MTGLIKCILTQLSSFLNSVKQANPNIHTGYYITTKRNGMLNSKKVLSQYKMLDIGYNIRKHPDSDPCTSNLDFIDD